MSDADATRWDRKYSDHVPNFNADTLLTDNHLLLQDLIHAKPSATALDLACGIGQNGLYLASMGFAVTGVDISRNGLDLLQTEAQRRDLNVTTQVVDLDQYHLQPDTPSYDVIVVFRYLNRGLFETLKRMLNAGGLLFYQTFNTRFLNKRRGFNPAYVLADGELAETFGDFEILTCLEPPSYQETSSQLVARYCGD